MSKMKEEQTQPDPSQQPQAATATAPDQNADQKNAPAATDPGNLTHTSPKMSKGEKAYIWGVYSGLNMWFNLGSSVVIADYFCNKGGKNLIAKGAGAIANALSGSNVAKYEKVFHHSQTALRTLSLLSGGWLLIIPIKMLEDNKRPIVHWLNEKLGVDQTAPDGHKLTPDEIYIEKEQPKQTWGNVILRRCMATAAVIGTGHAINEIGRDRVKSAAYTGKDDPFGGKSRIENFVVDKVNKGLESGYIPGGQTIRNNGTFQRYLGLAALDTVFTKITAVIMHVTNGAKKAKMPGEVGDTDDPEGNDKQKNHITFGPNEKPKTGEHSHAQQINEHDEPQRSFVQQHRPEGPQTLTRAESAENFRKMTEKDASSNQTLAV